MTKRILVDAVHPEEIRVAVADESRLIEFDFESVEKKQIKSNIYLGKITRVEPSLQAAFVEYGGNRQGFLPFSEIHFDYFQIPIEDKEKLQKTLESERKREDQRQLDMEARENARENSGEPARETSRDNDEESGGDNDREIPRDNDREPVRERGREFNRERGRGNSRRNSKEAVPEQKYVRRRDQNKRDYKREEPEFVIPAPFTKRDLQDLLRAEELAKQFTREIMGEDYYNEKYAVAVPAIAEAEPVAVEAEPVLVEAELVEAEPLEMEESSVPEERQLSRMEFYKQYKIQEVIKRNQIVLIQIVKEERGSKGASLTTYLALAGRYCVFMPNTDKGGGVSRRISNFGERRRIRDVIKQLSTPVGTSVIIRTAGMERDLDDIKKDYDYLLSVWDNIRKQTLESTAPSLIYEESDIVKRSLRDMLKGDVSEVLIEGEETFKSAHRFMEIIGPNQLSMLKHYTGDIPVFQKYKIEDRLDELYDTEVKLSSGGSIVITPTEALVSIDVNSGKATKERNVEDTALKTNIEAAREIARQLKLRDLAGLIVIDFIDMREMRNRKSVERELRDALRVDRAKIQLGRISAFGLLEMSRQRLRSSINESSSGKCPMCHGIGVVRTNDSLTLKALRAIEAESGRKSVKEIYLRASHAIAHNMQAQRKKEIEQIEKNDGVKVIIEVDTALLPNQFEISTQKFSSKTDRHKKTTRSHHEKAEVETPRPQQDVAETGASIPSEAKIDADVDEQLAAWKSEVADVEKVESRKYDSRDSGERAPGANRDGGNRGGRNNNRRNDRGPRSGGPRGDGSRNDRGPRSGGGRHDRNRTGGGRNNRNNSNYNGDSFGNETTEANNNHGNYDRPGKVERIERYQPEQLPREEHRPSAAAETTKPAEDKGSSKLVGLWKKITS